MRLPFKRPEPEIPAPARVFYPEEVDAFGGASFLGEVYVKECKRGEIVKKAVTIPYKRGVVKKKIVFYYLKKGDSPPISPDDMIPSTWD